MVSRYKFRLSCRSKCPVSADGVKFVESVDAGGAGQSVPVVTAALAPAIDPGLTGGGVGERTHIAGFTMNAVLIAAQESSFQRITLKSSHRVLPSLVDCMYSVDQPVVGAECSAVGVLAAGVASRCVGTVTAPTCVEF